MSTARAGSWSIGSPRSRPRSTRRATGTGAGALADFLGAFKDWRFDWLDVPAMIGAADMILEFPMVDQDPLPRWSFGRVTLLGDAAHPMVPRGSNGAGQAILDARALADCLRSGGGPGRGVARLRGEAARGDRQCRA